MASRRLLRRKVVVGSITGLAVLAAASSAWALNAGASGTSYRVATVARGSVVQSLTTTGAVSPIDAADLDFQVAGTVGRLLVKAGDHVRSGQQVARLNRSELRAAVTKARATLTAARATLASDEASQSSSATSSASSPTTGGDTTAPTGSGATPTPTPTTSSHGPPTGGSGTAATIARDQAALLVVQRQADSDLTTARTAIKAATAACANELDPAPATDGESTDPDLTACTEATRTLLADQTAVAADQAAVAKAEKTLDRDLAGAAAAAATASNSATSSVERRHATTRAATASQLTPAATASPAALPSRSTTPTQSTPSGGTVTASHLATDQASIDTDRAALATAVADLAQATLASPISGTVRAVTVRRGSAVFGTSSATGPAIEIVGSNQSKGTISLSAAQVRLVKVGMTAHLIPDGAQSTIVGHVIEIGRTATISDTGSATYPVEIALSAHAPSLVSGADAEVTVDLATARDVITVPTSALHRAGATTYLTVLRNGRPARVNVKVGAMGATLTQIRSGLTVGQRVVLANLNAAVPSSSTNLPTGRGGPPGGNFSIGGGGGSGPIIVGPPSGGQFQIGG